MPYVIFGLALILYGLCVHASAVADEVMRIARILEHPADYQAKVVTVEGRASEVVELPPRFRAHRCAGGPVYDAQLFRLLDESGSIQVGVAGTCKPGAMQPVVQANGCASVESWSRMKRILQGFPSSTRMP
jgi:hypothetical protein